MAYEVFARRFRPSTFDDLAGQEAVVRTLKMAIQKGRIAHSFLFSGIRGCGKTTLARILAKALNCQSVSEPTVAPCLQCEACTEISESNCMDVLEIDGASNRGIDQIRELRENVRYRPSRDRYKIYIIDEVHMLTTEAFNALLKTLEEPPGHVKFIFATTEFQKIPETILSRCQHYEFKRISRAKILDQLKSICETEKVAISEKALSAIAHAADGSLRDAVSALDQVVSYSDDTVDDADVQSILGLIEDDILTDTCRAIKQTDLGALFDLAAKVADSGHNYRSFCSALIERFRSLLVILTAPGATEILGLPPDEVDRLEKEAQGFSHEDLLSILKILMSTENEMKWALQPRYMLEMSLLRAAQMRGVKPLADIVARLNELSAGLSTGHESGTPKEGRTPARPVAAHDEPAKTAPQKSPARPDCAPAVTETKPLQDGQESVRRVLEAVVGQKPSLAPVESAVSKELRGEDLYLAFTRKERVYKEIVDTPENISVLEAALKEIRGIPGKVIIEYVADTPAGKPGPASRKEKTKRAALMEKAMKDPVVASALEIFNGKIVNVEEDEK